MHSSRMRTVRSSSHAMSIPACTGHCVSQHALGRGCVYLSMHWAGGCLPGDGGVCLGDVCPGESARKGAGVSQHALKQKPPMNRMTDRCKNITFPQLRSRTVKIGNPQPKYYTSERKSRCLTTYWQLI